MVSRAQPSIGQPAPLFSLSDQNGISRALSDFRGKWVLLYFYPRDMTPGCTLEARAFGKRASLFAKRKAMILGVSVDTVGSHARFATKHKLPFPILADENREVVRQYGVWGLKTFIGRKYFGTHRVSFLIDPKGVIAKIYDPVRSATHAPEVLEDLRMLQQK